MSQNSDTKNGSSDSTSSGQGLRDLIEKTFLAGMGAAAVTKDRIQDLVEELVNKGQMNAEEGRDVVERLAARTRDEARTVLRRADASLQSAYRGLGIGSKEDFEGLVLRLDQLEHRVRLLEEQSSSEGGPE